jgi:hypothetical protein
MKAKLMLIEATPNDLWTHGEVKNLSAPGHPTITPANCALKEGSTFISSPGLHAYRFAIKGTGTVKIQAFDAASGIAIAPAVAYDTNEAHGGHTYIFGVV